MNEEKSGCIKEYAVFQERTKRLLHISKLHACINFYAAAKLLGYGIRMGITRAGEVKTIMVLSRYGNNPEIKGNVRRKMMTNRHWEETYVD